MDFKRPIWNISDGLCFVGFLSAQVRQTLGAGKRGKVLLVVAVLHGESESAATGLAVTLDKLQDNVQRRVSQVVGQVGTDTETGFETVFEVLMQRP